MGLAEMKDMMDRVLVSTAGRKDVNVNSPTVLHKNFSTHWKLVLSTSTALLPSDECGLEPGLKRLASIQPTTLMLHLGAMGTTTDARSPYIA